MERYYPSEYYSFNEPAFPSQLNWFNSFLKRSLIRFYMGYSDPVGFIISLKLPHPFHWIRKKEIDFNSRILDVGTGSGRKLLSMARSGFKNLTGIDPYIKKDIIYENGVRIFKKDISEAEGEYDYITLHHSFEHMPNPAEVVQHIDRLLDKDGTAVIRIPVGDCHAWKKYGEFWVGLDAPRHFFIHTIKSIEILIEKTSLFLDEVIFDSSAHQFIMSEKYMNGLTLFEHDNQFSKKEIRNFEKEAELLNKNKQGDTACFYLKKRR